MGTSRLLSCSARCCCFRRFAYAQASIAGVVRDTSGAVLPGVTVEAASPALIEKVRSAVDRRHRAVPDRRSAARHLHRDVHAARVQHGQARRHRADRSFAATVNADLRVGALAETITVTGESPIVDVQSTTAAARARRTKSSTRFRPARSLVRTWRSLIPGSSRAARARPATSAAPTTCRHTVRRRFTAAAPNDQRRHDRRHRRSATSSGAGEQHQLHCRTWAARRR